MASALDPIKARLVSVVCGGRGADGSLGPDALRCSIPVGRFRKGLRNVPLRDAGYPKGGFDRATRWTWVDATDEDDPNNDVDGVSLQLVRVRLEVGYLTGAGDEAFVKLAGGTGETTAGALLDPEARSINDALRIRRALGWPEIVQGAGIDPALYSCHRQGPTTLEDLGKGRALASTVYVVRLELNNATAYDW